MRGSDKRITVGVALTPDLELLPVVEGLVGRMAEQMGFGESQRFNLQQGVGQACRRVVEKWLGDGSRELHLELTGFSDRLEIVVEDGDDASQMPEADSFLLNQLLDRVVFEEAEGRRIRMTLVMYLVRGETEP